MDIIEKINSLNGKILQLELERKKIVQQVELLKNDIVIYLNNEENSLEDRFIVYKTLPSEMLNQYFNLYDKDVPQSFEYVIDSLFRSMGGYIQELGMYFSYFFDFDKKQIKYEDFADEMMNGQYEDSEKKAATEAAFNFLVKNMIGSI